MLALERRRAGTQWDPEALGLGNALPQVPVSSVCEAAAIRRISIFTKTPPNGLAAAVAWAR